MPCWRESIKSMNILINLTFVRAVGGWSNFPIWYKPSQIGKKPNQLCLVHFLREKRAVVNEISSVSALISFMCLRIFARDMKQRSMNVFVDSRKWVPSFEPISTYPGICFLANFIISYIKKQAWCACELSQETIKYYRNRWFMFRCWWLKVNICSKNMSISFSNSSQQPANIRLQILRTFLQETLTPCEGLAQTLRTLTQAIIDNTCMLHSYTERQKQLQKQQVPAALSKEIHNTPPD